MSEGIASQMQTKVNKGDGGFNRMWTSAFAVGLPTGWLEFNVPFQHKYGYIREERSGVESYPLYPVKEG